MRWDGVHWHRVSASFHKSVWLILKFRWGLTHTHTHTHTHTYTVFATVPVPVTVTGTVSDIIQKVRSLVLAKDIVAFLFLSESRHGNARTILSNRPQPCRLKRLKFTESVHFFMSFDAKYVHM